MDEVRQLIHPGPVAAERISSVPCVATHKRVTLRAGTTLLQAMAGAVGPLGAWFDLRDVPVTTLTFVRPAPSPDRRHVAWYSAETVLSDATILEAGALLGRRDCAAFAHIHGLWCDKDSPPQAGHLRAEQTILLADHVVDAWVIEGAWYESVADIETGFELFQPIATGSVEHPNAFLVRIRPNEILSHSLDRCTEKLRHPVTAIKGLGSLIGLRLESGHRTVDDAVEVLLRGEQGRDVIAVGFDGRVLKGRLMSDLNRVCVTFEVLLLTA